jgi:CheY-like chemotaxis protein
MDKKIRILIVDDEPNSRSLFSQILAKENFEAFTADSGSEAVEILCQDPQFDLILLDNLMVGLDGIDTLKLIKENNLTKNVRVLMTSGLDTPDEISKALQAGASGFIAKPININDLIHQIKQILNQ